MTGSRRLGAAIVAALVLMAIGGSCWFGATPVSSSPI